ncbi:DNRLRE domain-containing protein [Actinotalea ferrariae]|nr:DNRLRE domain-containing protein [Actinotalea ferrariae]
MGLLNDAYGRPGAWARTVTPVAMVGIGTLLVAGIPQAAAAAPPPVTPAPAPAASPTGPLTAPDPITAATIARLMDAPVEILGERTLTGSVFALPDGTTVAGMASGPVWVPLGGDGTRVEDWAELDLTLEAADDGTVSPVAHPGALVLSGGTPQGTTPDAQVTVASMTALDGTASSISWVGPLPEPRLEGARAIYPDVRPDMDMVVDATATGFEQFFVLHEEPAPAVDLTLPVILEAQDATFTETPDGSYSVSGVDGSTTVRVPVPSMWDAGADGDRIHPVTQPWQAPDLQPQRTPPAEMLEELQLPLGPPTSHAPKPTRPPGAGVAAPNSAAAAVGPHGPARRPEVAVERTAEVTPDAVVMTLQPQAEFLTDPQTQYPIVIDPEMGLDVGFDTYVQSGYDDDRSSRPELKIGSWNSGVTKTRTFMSFDATPLRGRQIYEARLYLNAAYSSSCSAGWQVWDAGLASSATRWPNQPAMLGHHSDSTETKGYDASCPAGVVGADVGGLVRLWASIPNVATVGVALRAANESSIAGYKEFYSAQTGYGPWVWVRYNSTPNAPTGLRVSHSPTGATSGAWVNTLTPTMSAVLTDPDGENVDGNFYLYRADTGTLVQASASGFVTNGSVASVQVRPTTASHQGLQEGKVYRFTARGSDWKVEGPAPDQFWFGVDTVAPRPPVVSSTAFPNDNAWGRDPTQPGTFTFQLPSETEDHSVRSYRWGLDKAPDPNQVVTATGAAQRPGTVTITPATPGRHVLHVQTVDIAGNLSAVSQYVFYAGDAGILSPEEGAQVVRRVRVSVGAQPDLDMVKFQWRHGPDGGDPRPFPTEYVSTSTNKTWTQEWQQRPTGNGYTTLDVGGLLGFQPGPIQIRAVVKANATDPSAGASAPATFTTQWVTLTVDPQADGASTTAIGPATVNLLTGDNTVSATDAEEFGLSIVRSASSRDTDAGLQLQGDLLSAAQQSATDATKFIAGNSSVTIATNQFHTGTSSLKIMPATWNTNGDSYAAVGSDSGSMMRDSKGGTGLRPGRTYRFSGWVFVPATGTSVPAPTSPRGLKMTLFTRAGTGPYTEPALPGGAATADPTIVNAWQRVTFDATIPAGSTEAFVRLYNGFAASTGQAVYWDDISVRELWSPFGPEWSAGTIDAAAGTAYTRVTTPYEDVAAVELSGGGEIWFTSANGVWWPQPGAEDLTLTATPSGFRLTELDGTITDFAKVGDSKDFHVQFSSPPVAAGATRHMYDTLSVPGVARLSRVIAPIEPGVDVANACTTEPQPARGCETLDLNYAAPTTPVPGTVFGPYPGRLTSVSAWSWTPGPDASSGAMTEVVIAQYAYDSAGRLRTVHDPRIVAAGGQALLTGYTYDAAGRVTEVKGAGEPPYRFEYGSVGGATGSGEWIDPAPGRLLRVKRQSLVPGTNQLAPASEDNITTVVYNVPLTRSPGGGPYDLDADTIATWAQIDGPTDATAIFGPQNVPAVSVATAALPGPDEYGPATVHYLNSSGREVNTASPAAADTPVQGFIDTAEYDARGNVIRTLDATNRLLALKALPGAAKTLADLGMNAEETAATAALLDSRTTYSEDGLDVLTQLGPTQQLAVANDPSDVRNLRPRTTNSYGTGFGGLAAHLVTSTTVAGVDAAGAEVDPVTTIYNYAPIDDEPSTGPTSGYVHKQPTQVIVGHLSSEDPGLVAQVLYDDRGRPIRSQKPGADFDGVDAATTLSIFYTAGPNPADVDCGGRPEWAGQPCLTRAAGPVTGHEAHTATMSTNLPVKRITGYNQWGSPTVVTETVTETVNGVDVKHSRTTTTVYDAADRVQTVSIVGTGTDVGAPIQTTRSVYDPATGDVTETQSLRADGSVDSRVVKQLDALGRLVSYDDGAGAVTTTTYDRFGRPTRAREVIAGTTVTTDYGYDDPRGYLTSITDSVVADTLSATWGPDGQLETQSLPGGVTLTIGYDAARVPTSRTYTNASSEVIWEDSVVENHRGQWISHTSTTGTATYSYDRFGRLIQATDDLWKNLGCTVRAYGYANSPRSNRTQFATASGPSEQCPTVTLGAPTATYDTADRLLSTASDAGVPWVYDPLGRITSMPAAGDTVTNKFYVNDLIQQQTQVGVSRTTWTLDPLHRRSTNTIDAWVGDAWGNSATKVSHYANDSDEPSWIAEGPALATDVTRYISGVEGDIALTSSTTGNRELQLVNLHGDVVGALPIADGASQATWTALELSRSDEFGNPVPLSGAGATTRPPARYGWLGAAQRSAEALGGVILMGVRLYSPTTGRFLSVDPVPGGSANAYDYCNADPINCRDFAGTFSFGQLLTGVAVVGSLVAFIPGPVGAAAAGIAAVAYAATGNTTMALVMGATAAAQLVGLGPAVRVAGAAAAARAANAARTAGQMAARAAPRIQRASTAARAVARDARDAAVILRQAHASRGMAPGFGNAITVSARAANWAGRVWTLGGRATSVGGYISRNRLLQYRAPSSKPSLGIRQANFEWRSSTVKGTGWPNNYHVNIR